MSGLRDQLLKSGLVNEKQVKKAQKEKHKEQRGQGHAAAAAEERQRLQQAQAEKVERDRLLNQQRKEEADRRALVAQVRQLIDTQRLTRQEGELPFNFTAEGKVKKWYLDRKQRDQLVNGQAGIVKLDDRYEIVPRETAEKIADRMAEAIVLLHDIASPGAPPAGDSDPYAAYQVPDDLIW